jgi:serine/threonine protein kinase
MIAQTAGIELIPSPTQQLGKYQLVATLGQGGMGTVYLALASGFGQFRKLLVVKELRQDLTRQAGFVDMFMDEAKLAARLAHPNVVQTFEASEVDDRYFLAMEYLDGQSLSTLLDRLSASPLPKMSLWMHIQILCDALSGLHYAHELLDYDGSPLGVVHRDVSPQNVFVTYHGQVKVVDFGVAKVANATIKTAPGMFVGKFSYAAPEQVMGGAVDARTDVFAAGVMLWQAIAGRPFSDRTPSPAACRARCEGTEPRIAEVVPDVDPALARICDRALAVDPDDRYDSAIDLRAELQDYLQHAGVRVEAAQIGQLMHEVFDTERRSLHARIEQAMRRTGVSESAVDDMSIFQLAEKDPTAVADLSSLVEVSLERDDQKIRQGYAHSKITLVRPPSKQEPAMLKPKSVQPPSNRLLIVTALAVCLVSGVVVAVLSEQSSGPIEIESRSSFATHSVNSPPPAAAAEVPPQELGELQPLAVAAPPSRSQAQDRPRRDEEAAPEPQQATGTASAARREPSSAAQRAANASAPSKSRSRSSAARSPSSRDVPEPAVFTLSAVESAPAQRPHEEGADLPFVRHITSVRIDSENPYR